MVCLRMNAGTRGGRYRDVPYFDGGIFAQSAAVASARSRVEAQPHYSPHLPEIRLAN